MPHNLLKKFALCSTVATCTLFSGVQADAEAYFGFSPLNPDIEATSALGSGKNGYTEAAFTLDPAANPVVAALKGTKIIGLRCYMRSDYRQKRKKTSAVNVRTGSLDGQPVKNYADFTQGWNEIILDSPVEIADEPLFIGPMVYETSGTPYPFVSAHGPGFDGGFNVSLNKEAWQQFNQRGNLLMQLILDKNPEDMPLAAMAALSDLPLVIEPQSEFNCNMAIHNFSGIDIDSVEITVVTDEGKSKFTRTVELDSPIAPFDTKLVEATLNTGSTEDAAVGYEVAVTGINGKPTEASPAMRYSLHITADAFLRIPLIEEFTSQSCTNCPFMMYYIDRAMEEFGKPHVYITRHSGFVKDRFTIKEDEDLVYLFGPVAPYNPAVMYDRTVFDENGETPVTGASVASTAPYLEAINLAASQPALAKVIVDGKTADGKATCSVSGRIARGIDIDNLYVCAYMIENKIPRDATYFQLGIDDAPDDAPEDLAETFSHNGIIRVKFHRQNLGDLIAVDPETREFHVDFESADVKPEWVSANCETVAFICRVDKDNIADNFVLNAGGSRWNELVNASVDSPIAEGPGVAVFIGSDNRVNVKGEYESICIHSISGQKVSPDAPLCAGVYVVSVVLPDGRTHSEKIAVR